MVDAAIAEAKDQLAKITIDYEETTVPHGFDPTDSSSGSVSVPSNGSTTAVVANQPWQAHVTWEKRDALTGGRITEDAEYVFYEWNVDAKVKPGEEDRSISVLRTDGIERVYALEQYDLPESEYLDKAPLQWTEAQHSDLIHRVEDAAQLADISVLSDLRHGTGFFDASRNVIHIREGNNSTEQLKSLLEGYSEAVITRTSTSDKPVAELESAALTALLQVRCGVPIDDQLAERITAALEDAGNVGGFSMRDSVARLHNAMEYCVRYAELEQTSEQYQAQQIEPEELTPQSEAFMEMM